jgi:hypothetical protein
MNSYAEQLRDEIVSAAVRQHRARRRRRAIVVGGAGVVAVAGVIALVVGLLVAPDERPAAADGTVEVVREEHTTLVRIVDPAKPDEVVADLRAIGLDVERVERPTGPSLVGAVVSLVVEDSTPTDGTEFLSAYVAPGSHVEVGVGVPANEGEAYAVGTDAFAAGEPLDCLGWPGQTGAELAVVAERAGISLQVIDEEQGPVEHIPTDRVVLRGTAISVDRVLVSVGPGPVRPRPASCEAAPSAG